MGLFLDFTISYQSAGVDRFFALMPRTKFVDISYMDPDDFRRMARAYLLQLFSYLLYAGLGCYLSLELALWADQSSTWGRRLIFWLATTTTVCASVLFLWTLTAISNWLTGYKAALFDINQHSFEEMYSMWKEVLGPQKPLSGMSTDTRKH